MKTHYYCLLRGGLVVLLALMLATVQAQQLRFVPYAEFRKDMSNPRGEGGTLYSMLKYASDTRWCGYFTEVRFYDPAGKKIVTTLKANVIRRKNGEWSVLGNVPFTSMFSAVYGYAAIGGKEYVGVQYSDSIGTLASTIQVFDPATRAFKPVHSVKFSSGVTGLYPMRNSTLFVHGNFYKGRDMSGEQVLSGASFWSMKNNTLKHLPELEGRGVEPHGPYDTAPDSTFMHAGAYTSRGYRILYPSSTESKESLYPLLPQGTTEILAVKVFAKDRIYIVVLKQANTAAFLRLKGTPGNSPVWEQVAEFAQPPSDISKKMVVNMACSNGQCYFSGDYTEINGVQRSAVVSYNESSGFTDLPAPGFAIVQGSMKSFDGEVYFLDEGDLIFGEEKMYILRPVPKDIVPMPAIARIEGLQKASSVPIRGTGIPNGTVALFEGNTELSVVSIAGDSSWSATVSFADGRHAVHAVAYRGSDIPSSPSPPVSFAVDANGPPPPTIVSPGLSVGKPNDVRTKVRFMATSAEKKSVVTVRVDGETASRPVPYEVEFIGWGNHVARFVATDSAGHDSQYAEQRFSTNTYVDIVDPRNQAKTLGRAMQAYPNPATTSVTVHAADTVPLVRVAVYSIDGRTVSVQDVTNETSALVDISRFVPGVLSVIATDANGVSHRMKLLKH